MTKVALIRIYEMFRTSIMGQSNTKSPKIAISRSGRRILTGNFRNLTTTRAKLARDKPVRTDTAGRKATI